MAVPTTISPGPRSPEQDGFAEAIDSHPIWTELGGPVTRGSEFRLSSDPLDPANAGSSFMDEIQYLQKAGYHLEGSSMVNP